MRPLSATAAVAVSVLTPTSSAESPQTLGARNFRPPNRPGHRRRLLCCRQSIAEPLAVGPVCTGAAREAARMSAKRQPSPIAAAPKHRSSAASAVPPHQPHRSSPHRSTEVPAVNRGHRSSRHTAVRSAEVSHFDTPKYRFSTHRSFWIGSVFNSARHSDRPTFAHVPPYALTGSGCGLCSSLRTSSRCAPSVAAITSIVVRVGLPSPRS
jgi:hypothetical protein